MKTLLLLFALTPAADARTVAPAVRCEAQKVAKKTTLTFPDGKTIKIDVVDTPATREIGLMCVTKIGKDYGMLFMFPQDMHLNFWMKHTLVPLDILWIGPDKKVVVIREKLKASTLDTPDDEIASAGGKGQFVLELASGEASRRKLKVGDQLKFEAVIPEK